jgi:ABC-type branched-subunit amino acid transport system ATPase component
LKALAVRDLTAWFGSTVVVHGVSFDVAEGGAISIVGRNGVGKTTLVRAVLGLVQHAGDVELFERSVRTWPTHRIVRRGVAYAPQERTIFADLSVGENISFARYGEPPEPERLEEVLERFARLRTRLNQRAGTLSGGEQKMLILARALASPAPLVILDEIVEGVQPNLVEEFGEALAAERRRGRTLIVVEQHLAFALPLCDHYLVLTGGTVVEEGPVVEESREAIERHLVL